MIFFIFEFQLTCFNCTVEEKKLLSLSFNLNEYSCKCTSDPNLIDSQIWSGMDNLEESPERNWHVMPAQWNIFYKVNGIKAAMKYF